MFDYGYPYQLLFLIIICFENYKRNTCLFCLRNTLTRVPGSTGDVRLRPFPCLWLQSLAHDRGHRLIAVRTFPGRMQCCVLVVAELRFCHLLKVYHLRAGDFRRRTSCGALLAPQDSAPGRMFHSFSLNGRIQESSCKFWFETVLVPCSKPLVFELCSIFHDLDNRNRRALCMKRCYGWLGWFVFI